MSKDCQTPGCGHAEEQHSRTSGCFATYSGSGCEIHVCTCRRYVASKQMPLGHEYVGNLCCGFGGRVECEWFDPDTRQRCGKLPVEHTQSFHDILTDLTETVREQALADAEVVWGEWLAAKGPTTGLPNALILTLKELFITGYLAAKELPYE